MSTHEPQGVPPSSVEPVLAPEAGAARPRASWALAVVAAIVAGVGSWLVAEGMLEAYKGSFNPKTGPALSAQDLKNIANAKITTGTAAFGATGGLLGLALGIAGGLSRRSARAAALAGLIGMLVGGLGEGGLARLDLAYVYETLDLQADDLLQALLIHESLWAFVGLSGGLALGLGLGGGLWWKAAIGGLIGAAIGSALFDIIGAIAFATEGTDQPVAGSLVTRALAHMLVTLGTAAGALLVVGAPKEKPASP